MKNFAHELAIIEDCRYEGYMARQNNKMRVPNQKVMDHVGNGPVGEPRTITLMQAFHVGWQRHEDEEIRALGLPVR